MATGESSRTAGGVRLRGLAARVSESIESRLWPLPVAAILVAVALGVAVPRIDLLIDGVLRADVDSVIFNGGAETARSVLSSIAGSLITATSLTFSLTVVALQLASSQASPRVLRLFARDRRVHSTLAVFLGTFAYSITVLRSIRDATDEAAEFVPRIAVTTGFLLTLVSVIMLVFFLAHLATQLRVETMLKDIHAETDRTIELVGDSHAGAPVCSLEVRIPPHRRTVVATSSGFITSRDRMGMVEFAARSGIVIQEIKRVGENITAGTPLVEWWKQEPALGDDSAIDHEAVEDAVLRAHTIGYERTAAQDVDYGVQQIVDIGVRALSPGINDPTTAVNALGHLSAIIARMIDAPQPPAAWAGEKGELRLLTVSQGRGDMVGAALSQIRHYGAGDPLVVRRLLQVIADLAYLSRDADVRAALREQLDGLRVQIAADGSDPVAAKRMASAVSDLTDRLSS